MYSLKQWRETVKKVHGFTLIELVVVIVILGILAVTAAPKFLGISRDAKIATLNAMAGALRSGSKMIYGKAVLNHKEKDAQILTIGNAEIHLHSGYPTGNWQNGIRYIVGLDNVDFIPRGTVCRTDWCGTGNQRTTPSNISAGEGRVGKVYTKGFSWDDQCGVYYVNREDGSEPEIGVELQDC